MKNVILLLSFLLPFLINAQNDFDLKWSKTYQAPLKGLKIIKIVGSDETGFFVFKKKYPAIFYLEKFDNNMNLIYSEELVLPSEDKKDKHKFSTLVDVVVLNNNPVLLGYFYDEKKKKVSAHAYLIDSKGKIESKYISLGEVFADDMYDGSKRKIVFELSKDKSKLLVQFKKIPKTKEEVSFLFKLFDAKLNVLWEKEVDLNYREKYYSLGEAFTIDNYVVDNNGDLFFSALIKTRPIDVESSAKKYIIVNYKHNSDELIEKEIMLNNDKWIQAIKFDINNNELLIGGFYSNEKNYKVVVGSYFKVKGVFSVKLDLSSLNVVASATKDFTPDFLKGIKEKGLKDFSLDYIFLKKKGGFYLLSGHFDKDIANNLYKSHDIIVMSVDDNNKIDWIQKILKRSAVSGPNMRYLSYAVNFNSKNNDLNIIINDNPENISLAKSEDSKVKFAKTKKLNITRVKINKEGNSERTQLTKVIDKLIFVPNAFYNFSNNEILIYKDNSKEYNFGKLIFK